MIATSCSFKSPQKDSKNGDKKESVQKLSKELSKELQELNLIIGSDERQVLSDQDTSYAHAVGILTVDGKNRCSAFAISSRRIITAVHCVGKDKSAEIPSTAVAIGPTPSPTPLTDVSVPTEQPTPSQISSAEINVSTDQSSTIVPPKIENAISEPVNETSQYLFTTLSGKTIGISKIEKIFIENDIVYMELTEDSPDFLIADKLKIDSPLILPGFDPDSDKFLVHRDCKATEIIGESGIIKHECDTLPGASGAPVLQNGRVVAVHIGSFKDDLRSFNLAVDMLLLETANLTSTGLLEGYKPERFSCCKKLVAAVKTVTAPVVAVVAKIVNNTVDVFGNTAACFGARGTFSRYNEARVYGGSYANINGKSIHIPYHPRWPAAVWPYAQKADGCSFLESDRPQCMRDTWGPVSFKEACHAHDRCYYTFNGPSESFCNDVEFLGNLKASCERDLVRNRPWLAWSVGHCYAIASAYYGGVKIGIAMDSFGAARKSQKDWLKDWATNYTNGVYP